MADWSTDQSHLQELVKKLQDEKLSCQSSLDSLKAELERLTKELVAVKKENVSLKAEKLLAESKPSDYSSKPLEPQPVATDARNEDKADDKLSGQSNLNNIMCCATPTNYLHLMLVILRCSVHLQFFVLVSLAGTDSQTGVVSENEEYQKIDDYVLYYHKPSGYYYESVSKLL